MPKTLLLNESQVLLPDAQHLKSASLMIRALNHPLRLKLLKTLHRKKSATVTELYQELNEQQPIVSMNLHKLLKADFVSVVKVGKSRLYSVNNHRLNEVQRLVKNFLQPA